MRWTVEGVSDAEIARRLGHGTATIRRYREEARTRALAAMLHPEETYDLQGDLPAEPGARAKRGPGPGPHIPGSWKHPRSRQPRPAAPPPLKRRRIEDVKQGRLEPNGPDGGPAPPFVDRTLALSTSVAVDPDDVLDAAETTELRMACLDLRKGMYTFREIAEKLGISEADARAHTAYALRDLQDSVTTHADLERRLMVEQIDDMIRAIRPQTIGSDDHEPVLEAIDRMLKLMDRKAKLLGLDQAESVDIMVRLQSLAVEGNYDMLELMDLAKDTLSKHRIKMPLHLLTLAQDAEDAEPDTHSPYESADDAQDQVG